MAGMPLTLEHPPAAAKWYGSTLRARPNVNYGCESAATRPDRRDRPRPERTCTYRHGGYLFSNRPTFLVPRSGRITHIRVKAGNRPRACA